MCLELVSSKLSQVDRSAVPVPIWRVHPLRATRLLALRHQTGFDFSEKCKKHSNCCFPQAYTQSGGKRPFGVSILYMGWDKHFGYQLVPFPNHYMQLFNLILFSVPVRPIWQLRRVESHLYREQLECCRVYAEAGVQGWTVFKGFTRRMLRFELS